MDKKNFYKINNVQSLKNIINTKDKRIVSFKQNFKFKSKNYHLPKLKSELFTTLIKKNNKNRNNFLTSSNLSLSDNETFNINSKDYLYKHRNIRKQILTNPNLSPIDSREQILTFHNSDNGEREKNKIFSTVNSSENINNNSRDLFLDRSSKSLSNSNSKNKIFFIKKKSMKKKNIEEKNNTIINIFNTSLNNTPNIYFFSQMITESNSKKEINNKTIDNPSLNIKKEKNFFSPLIKKKTRKMLTLNSHMFNKLKNFNIKFKNKKTKKQLQKKNSFEELKIEEIRKNIMKKMYLNSNKDTFNYSDGNVEKNLLKKKKQKLKNLNTLNETKNFINFNSLSSIKNSDNETSFSNIESYKNLDIILIEEKRRKLEEKLIKNFGLSDCEKFENNLLEKKNIFINHIFNDQFEKVNNKMESQLKHKFSIINIDLEKYYNKEKLYILKNGEKIMLKVEKYYLTFLYRSTLSTKFTLNKYSVKELINIYLEKETYNLLKENYLKTEIPELISIIKDFNLEMKIENKLNKNKIFISKNTNYIYILIKFIMNDIQDGIFRLPIDQKRISIFIKKNNKFYKTINPFRKQITLRRKSALKSIAVSKNILEKMSLFKRTLTRKKIKKNNLVSKYILKKDYFNRKGEKHLSEQVSYIRNLKLRPSIKIQNIQFNIEDPREAIQKNKNMTKEGLIFRTEEIKAEMKKNLKTIEEILFFLIKENNFREFIDILEKYHVSIESKNNKGSTFLVYSVQCNNINFVTYLLEKGANINAQDKNLNTALHYALSDNNFNLADMLLKNGANERLINNNGLTPWQMMSK